MKFSQAVRKLYVMGRNALIIAFLFILTLMVVLYFSSGSPSARDFKANESKYVAVVNRIAEMDLGNLESEYFVCDPNWDPDSIRSRSSTTDRYNIAAIRLADGRLVVSLITRDWGHAGVFGYVYCSGELTSPDEIGPDSRDGSEVSIGVAAGMKWFVDDTLPGNWWVVSNHLQ